MKVLLRIPLSIYSGYGNDGISLARTLVKWGADVYLQPSVVQAPIPTDIAMLLTKPLQAPFDLVIDHHDPAQLVSTEEAKNAAEVFVGWSMWEWTSLEFMKGRSKLKEQWKHFDAIIGYDPVSVEAFQPYVRKSQPLLTLQGGYDPELWPLAQERDWHEDRFGFCQVGQLHNRKAPFISIQAFQELKNDPAVEFDQAELHLKTNLPGLHRAMEDVIPKLRIHYAVWSQEILYKFYEAQHVLLAPSMGEGKNLPALEMQSTGGTVIASDFGGHKMWLNPAYNYALDGTVMAQDPSYPNAKSFAASVESMKELMLHCYQNRSEVRLKGELAAQMMPKLHSWDAVIEKLFMKLRESVDGGERLWAKAQMCRRDAS